MRVWSGVDCCCLQNHVILVHPSEGVPVTSAGKEVKVFTCEECGKPFPTSTALTKHVWSHTGEKPFECPMLDCGTGFTQFADLKVSRVMSFLTLHMFMEFDSGACPTRAQVLQSSSVSNQWMLLLRCF